MIPDKGRLHTERFTGVQRAAVVEMQQHQCDAWEQVKTEVPPALPSKLVGLCLPITFSDVSRSLTEVEISDFLNKPGYKEHGNFGSVHDYFYDNSFGKVDFQNVVAPRYQARQPFRYYDDATVKYGERARELVAEVLQHHLANGFDFSQLTWDPVRGVHAISLIITGTPAVSAMGLWDHQDALCADIDLENGRVVKKYAIFSADGMGSYMPLGHACHEYGHLLFSFPDLYDTLGVPVGPPTLQSTHDRPIHQRYSAGVGNYCLMGTGGAGDNYVRNPVNLCAYLRLWAGWVESTLLEKGTRYKATVLNREVFHYWTSEDAVEYFLIENRQKTGWDSYLPSAGLAIWHIDQRGCNRNEQMTAAEHYECSLEQADGQYHLESLCGKYGDANDLYSPNTQTNFGAATNPSSHWWDGTESGLEITNISDVGNEMEFRTA